MTHDESEMLFSIRISCRKQTVGGQQFALKSAYILVCISLKQISPQFIFLLRKHTGGASASALGLSYTEAVTALRALGV